MTKLGIQKQSTQELRKKQKDRTPTEFSVYTEFNEVLEYKDLMQIPELQQVRVETNYKNESPTFDEEREDQRN